MEDDAVNRTLAVGILRGDGHNVTVALDGHEALAAWERETFDLILMDVEMPRMDGFQATAELRRREAPARASGIEHRTPIVAMTAHQSAGVRERCLTAGMDAHICKPVRARDLLAVVSRVASGDDAGRYSPGAAVEIAVSIDRGEILEYFNGDLNLLREVAASFHARVPGLTRTLACAVAAGDCETAWKTAHGIKGLVGFLGASRAFAAAQRLESIARGGDPTNAAEALLEVERELHALLRTLPELIAGAADPPPRQTVLERQRTTGSLGPVRRALPVPPCDPD